MYSKSYINRRVEKRWDLICENAKECQTEGPVEYLQKDDRENWISEKKELKNQYMELCSSWSDMISYQHIDKVEYMCFGGMGNFCAEYDIYNTLNKIDDCKELCDWLLKVAKSESFSSGERDKPYYAELDGLFELNAEMAEDIVSKEKYLSLGGLSGHDDVIEILSRHPGAVLGWFSEFK